MSKRKKNNTKKQGNVAAKSNPEIQESTAAGDNSQTQEGTAAGDDSKIQESIIPEEKPEVQESAASEEKPEVREIVVPEEKPEVQETVLSEEKSEVQQSTAAGDSQKLKTPILQKKSRKLKGSKVSEDISEVQVSITPEEKPVAQESIASEEKPEVQESTAAGDISEVQESAASEEIPELQESTAAGDSQKLKTPFFQRIIRKLKVGKVSEGIPEVRGSVTSEEIPEVQESAASEEVPEVQESAASEEIPEVQESVVTEEIPEVQESTAAGDISKSKTSFFQRIFRKAGRGKVSEDSLEVQESVTPEEIPEVQKSVVPEEIPEVQESAASEEIPEVQESAASEEIPEVQGITAVGDIPKSKTSFFQRIFRKSGRGKVSEDRLEIQESITTEEIPEVQESVVSGEIPEVQESAASEEIPEVQGITAVGDIPKSKTSFFQRIFRKSGRGKVSEDRLEIQESITTEEIPEVQESVVSGEIPEVQESKAAEIQGARVEVEPELPEEAKPVYLKKKKPWTLAKKIIISFASVLVLAVLTVGLYALSIFYNPDPLQGFDTIGQQMNTPSPTVLPQPSASEELPTPSPTVDPYEVLMSKADTSILDKTVNILLIGVDHGEERDAKSWNGKHAWHSDVMIILSINTETNKVSLISLPRDTYAKIPGVSGIYKLNAALNCGGGWPKDKAFMKVCQAASWMIGGIPINYYYAVDFDAVKGLVDAIGGVDFNLEITFKINGRRYKKGMQHMDGQAALDYMRVRHGEDISGSGNDTDLKRINRQKKMLKAVFEKLKSTGTIFSLPDILSSFEGNLYTNVDISKTTGLAAYAYKNIDPDNIDVYSMDGDFAYLVFDFNFVITDLSKRVSIIKKVYGVDISKDKAYKAVYSQYGKYSHNRAWSLWFNMQTEVATKKSRSLLSRAKKILDADAAPAEPTKPPADPGDPPADPPGGEAAGSVNVSATALLTGKYGDKERQLYQTCMSEYSALKKCKSSDASDKRKNLIAKFKKDVQALCKALKIKVKNWDVYWQVVYNAKNGRGVNQHYVKNQIYVDFR